MHKSLSSDRLHSSLILETENYHDASHPDNFVFLNTMLHNVQSQFLHLCCHRDYCCYKTAFPAGRTTRGNNSFPPCTSPFTKDGGSNITVRGSRSGSSRIRAGRNASSSRKITRSRAGKDKSGKVHGRSGPITRSRSRVRMTAAAQ